MKKFAVFLLLTVIATGCTKTSPPTAEELNANLSEKSKPSAYPPVNPRIMTAQNRLLDETPFKLEDKKGKVILVNLWATWCGPCREEIPHLVELQNKYKDQGLEVVGLDVDPESKEDIEAFVSEMKINYTIGWSNEDLTVEVMKMNQMSGIPQSILINREGQLTGIFRGGGPNVIRKMKETTTKIVTGN